jgi:hypothetical protein
LLNMLQVYFEVLLYMLEGGGRGPQEGDVGPKLQGCPDLEEVVLQGWSKASPSSGFLADIFC